ncbi:HAD-superfamily hydrolase, subfamily IA, variant 1 [Acidovorax delafieldii 2AN]|uniref:HAD-superfamily hydrolase, subfamily IA, variant 1 n=1 Tax=Acidovorax delafieldii 2AN TaxID=573060 RepID=C5T8F9_ACIDE|nr:HAD-IA family hydrolase [Acidovorax delafieldii]EER59242.1 HAD-superfamily hydrolase, subfamily IA, variant 1 [Acidovorax delafieldii 2AN]
MPPAAIDLTRIRAVTLDLDDTLWPIWPTITRAEASLLQWLVAHAPSTAALYSNTEALRAIRNQMVALRPDLKHDLSALRRESIRLALTQAGDDAALAEPAFEVFFAERQRVELFVDAHSTLAFLSQRYPVVAVSNGNADVHRVGIGHYFKASISAREFGVAKPDPRIFHAAASAVGVQPHEVLHVGDDATLDAQAAINAGMQAVWLNSTGQDWPHAQPPHATVATLTELCRMLEGLAAPASQPASPRPHAL